MEMIENTAQPWKFFDNSDIAPQTPKPVRITGDQEDVAARNETEREARRRRVGMLRRVFTTPGQNFVSGSNIGRNTLMGA